MTRAFTISNTRSRPHAPAFPQPGNAPNSASGCGSLRKRKHMPLGVKLAAALHQLGLFGVAVDFDHVPPLALRERDPATGRYTPDENDPRYIVPMARLAHRAKTNGGPVTCADGDIHKIAKAKRLAKKQAEFRARVLERPPREEKSKNRWPTQKFQTRRKPA
jgi:hypothetical protein